MALHRADHFLRAGITISLETTLAGRTHLQLVARARATGFAVHLLYFSVPDVAECLCRIRRRVAEGGHDVPEADVRRRWARSLANFPDYAARSDLWRVVDNRGRPRVVAEGSGRAGEVLDAAALQVLPSELQAAVAMFAGPE